MTPAQEMRVLVAFAAQPFVAALIAFGTFSLIEVIGRWPDNGSHPFDAAMSMAAGAGLVAVFVVPLAALPAFAWQVRRGPLTLVRVLASGAVLGNAPSAAILVLVALHAFISGERLEWTRVMHDPIGLVRALALGSFVGLSSASVFWLIVRRHVSGDPADDLPAL